MSLLDKDPQLPQQYDNANQPPVPATSSHRGRNRLIALGAAVAVAGGGIGAGIALGGHGKSKAGAERTASSTQNPGHNGLPGPNAPRQESVSPSSVNTPETVPDSTYAETFAVAVEQQILKAYASVPSGSNIVHTKKEVAKDGSVYFTMESGILAASDIQGYHLEYGSTVVLEKGSGPTTTDPNKIVSIGLGSVAYTDKRDASGNPTEPPVNLFSINLKKLPQGGFAVSEAGTDSNDNQWTIKNDPEGTNSSSDPSSVIAGQEGYVQAEQLALNVLNNFTNNRPAGYVENPLQ